MTALASSADVAAVLGRTLTAGEMALLPPALDAASATTRAVTGRKYEAGTFTVRRRVRSCKVTLDAPESVESVDRINDDGTVTALTGYTLRGSTIYNLGHDAWVEVTYTSAGSVPTEVVSVTAEMAARKLTMSTPDGATSYTVTKGPFTESASFDAPTEAVSPTAAEMRVLKRHALLRSSAVSLLG